MIKYVYLIALFLFCVDVHSQSKSELEKKREQTKSEMQLTNSLLSKVQSSKKTTLSKLTLLKNKVELQSRLVNELDQEVERLENELQQLEKQQTQLNSNLQQIKTEYAKLIYHYYYYKHQDNYILFLLSSEDFGQFYRRLKYLQQLSEYRKKQADRILEMNALLEEKSAEIAAVIKERKTIMAERESELRELENTKKRQEKAIQQLKSEEKSLRAKLKKQQEIARKLQAAIQALIDEEAKKAIAAAAAKAPTSKSKAPAAKVSIYDRLTPEEKVLSDQFGKNKGKLPWPTRKGIITSYFGKHEHPVLKKIYIENNGIDITTVKGEKVRAVSSGVVSKIFAIKGANNTIIVRHGNYLTVYQNIVNVKVSSGQKVEAKQTLGEVFYNEEEDQSVLHFEIWNELSKLNPSEWLARN